MDWPGARVMVREFEGSVLWLIRDMEGSNFNVKVWVVKSSLNISCAKK